MGSVTERLERPTDPRHRPDLVVVPLDARVGSRVLSLGLVGALTRSTAPLLRQALDRFDADHRLTVRISLAGLTSCDPAGVEALRIAYDRITRRKASLRLLWPPPPVRHMIELCGRASLLEPAAGESEPPTDATPTPDRDVAGEQLRAAARSYLHAIDLTHELYWRRHAG